MLCLSPPHSLTPHITPLRWDKVHPTSEQRATRKTAVVHYDSSAPVHVSIPPPRLFIIYMAVFVLHFSLTPLNNKWISLQAALSFSNPVDFGFKANATRRLLSEQTLIPRVSGKRQNSPWTIGKQMIRRALDEFWLSLELGSAPDCFYFYKWNRVGVKRQKESRYVTLLVSLDIRSLVVASCFGVW